LVFAGFVDVNEVLEMNMMRHHTLEEVLQEVDTSLSHRHTKRFESKTFNGKTLIRALFCRNFEPVSWIFIFKAYRYL
jgi:hypothetical protein